MNLILTIWSNNGRLLNVYDNLAYLCRDEAFVGYLDEIKIQHITRVIFKGDIFVCESVEELSL